MCEPRRCAGRVADVTMLVRIVHVAVLAFSAVIMSALAGPEVYAQDDDLAAARRISAQIELLEAAEDYATAIPLADRMVAIYEKTLGPEHSDTDAARGKLAVLYILAGKPEDPGPFEKAEAILRQSWAIFGPTRGLVSGRAFLVPEDPEPQGYGLYSYLLFAAPPRDDAERARYTKALEAYIRLLYVMWELERHKAPSELNVTLVPVRRPVELFTELKMPEEAVQAAEKVLEVYDYARAGALLDDLGMDVTRSGPYLVSRMPGAAGRTIPRLFLDMSHVAPARVWDWIWNFRWLAAQERSWSEMAMQKLELNIRNVIAITADTIDSVGGAFQQLFRVKSR
jgi:hypothetical protein